MSLSCSSVLVTRTDLTIASASSATASGVPTTTGGALGLEGDAGPVGRRGALQHRCDLSQLLELYPVRLNLMGAEISGAPRLLANHGSHEIA